jgi:hypothetical protein
MTERPVQASGPASDYLPRESTAPPPRAMVPTSSAGNGANTVRAAVPAGSSQTPGDEVKAQATEVAQSAAHSVGQLTDSVTQNVGAVTAEAGRQARDLLEQATSELSEQAASQQERVAAGLHTLADELADMVQNSTQRGLATDLADQAAGKARDVADWLGHRDPGMLLAEVRSFARRKPGTYLALALGAGVLAGRLTRGVTASKDPEGPGVARSLPSGDVPQSANHSGNGLSYGGRPEELWPRPALDPETELGTFASSGHGDRPPMPGLADPGLAQPGRFPGPRGTVAP